MIDGELQRIPAAITEVAAWDPTGSGPHSVTAEIAFCESVVARGGEVRAGIPEVPFWDARNRE